MENVNKKKKLELKRQDIRQLTPAEMSQAAGGWIWTITVTIIFIPTPAH